MVEHHLLELVILGCLLLFMAFLIWAGKFFRDSVTNEHLYFSQRLVGIVMTGVVYSMLITAYVLSVFQLVRIVNPPI